jgi:hypothetical protein
LSVIGLTCAVVPAGDFANAFADLSALEPVASVPFLALDPDASFRLTADGVKDGMRSKARAVSARLLRLTPRSGD